MFKPLFPVEKEPLLFPGQTKYKEGVIAFQKADYNQAHHCFEQAAAQNYPAAYVRLGDLYQWDGLIGPKNLQLSQKWFMKAYEQMDWLKAQADLGHADAHYNLAICYRVGLEKDPDFTKIFHHLYLAAEQNFADAQNDLGFCYGLGKGVKKNWKEAVYYHRLAAEQGFAVAQCNLGHSYQQGYGVKQDFRKAVQYYLTAAEQGFAAAQFYLGMCYQRGRGVEQNFKEALWYYFMAAEQAFAEAQYHLGMYYEHGQEVDQDCKLALHYFRLAAEQGHTAACHHLGLRNEHNQEAIQNLKTAKNDFLKIDDLSFLVTTKPLKEVFPQHSALKNKHTINLKNKFLMFSHQPVLVNASRKKEIFEYTILPPILEKEMPL